MSTNDIERLRATLEQRLAARADAIAELTEGSSADSAEAPRLELLGIWEWEMATNSVTWSDEMYRIWGVSRASFPRTYEAVRQLVHPDDRAGFDALAVRTYRHHEPFVYEHRIVRPDGTLRTVQSRGTVVVNSAGRTIRMFGTGLDITERQQAEQKLRRQKEVLQEIFDHIPVMVGAITTSGVLALVNGEVRRTLGWSFEELHAPALDVLAELYPDPQYRQRVVEFIAETNGEWGDFKTRTKDGRTIDTTWAMVHHSDGTHICIGQDISARKGAEDRLRHQLDFTEAITASMGEGVYALDGDGCLTFMNPAAEAALGWSQAELLGKEVHDIIHFQRADGTRRPPEECPLLSVLRSGRTAKVDSDVFTRRDGTMFPVSYTASPILTRGYVAGAVLTFHDITERKRAELMLQTFSQRLIETQEAERRRVARELHDEVGQALTAIKISLNAVQRSSDAESLRLQLSESTDIIDGALRQVRDLSLNLRPSLLDDLGLVAALRWYVDHEGRRAGLRPRFVADLSDTRLPPELETACFRIAQEALTNVVRHARARHVSVELRQRGSELHLSIRDDGIGFDVPASRSHDVSNVPLGLAGMQERALILDGNIEIVSAPEHGTEIHAWFPVPKQPSPPGDEYDTP